MHGCTNQIGDGFAASIRQEWDLSVLDIPNQRDRSKPSELLMHDDDIKEPAGLLRL